ncbi:MAG: prepilin-type cleavage/methylation protein [Pedosphaera sp.]|nr:prepilin-type cleavage/methylation protein [Pedosphaera sp.]
MKTQNINDAKRAFTVLELMVVILILVILMGLLFPMPTRSKGKAIRIQCVNSLKSLGIAFRIWADDNGDLYPMQCRTNDFNGPSFASNKKMFIYFQVMSNELSNPKMVVCPGDKKRTVATNFTTDFNSGHVSYFIGADANETNFNGLLAGDRNITSGIAPKNGMLEITTNQVASTNQTVAWTEELHNRAGNVLFADSHVEQLTSSKLREALMRSGMATNRLVFPP